MKVLHKAAQTLTHLVNREINYHRIRPTHLLLFLTYRCTGRCKTCTMWQRRSDQPEMTLEEWQRFIDMVAPYGIRNVEMFGGDALLRKDVLLPLVRYIRSKNIPEVDLVTNGNLMDQATAFALAEAGLNTLFVSLDGVEDTQDAVRGNAGSFARVKDTIAFMKAARNAGRLLRASGSRLAR